MAVAVVAACGVLGLYLLEMGRDEVGAATARPVFDGRNMAPAPQAPTNDARSGTPREALLPFRDAPEPATPQATAEPIALFLRSRGGEPLEGVEVALTAIDPHGWSAAARSDASGLASIDGREAPLGRRVRCIARGPSHWPLGETVVLQQSHAFALTERMQLSIRVLDGRSLSPLDGARVEVNPSSSSLIHDHAAPRETDLSGLVELTVPRDEMVVVIVNHDDFAGGLRHVYPAQLGEDPAPVEIALEPGRTIQGTLRVEDGSLLAGAVLASTSEYFEAVTTDEDGRFSLRASSKPPIPGSIRTAHGDRWDVVFDEVATRSPADVTVPAVHQLSGSLRIQRIAGEPVRDGVRCDMWLRRPGDRASEEALSEGRGWVLSRAHISSIARTSTDGDGRFCFRSLESWDRVSSVEVRLRSGWRQSLEPPGAFAGEAVELILPEVARIEGVVEGSRAEPPTVEVAWSARTSGGDDQRGTLHCAADGSFELSLYAPATVALEVRPLSRARPTYGKEVFDPDWEGRLESGRVESVRIDGQPVASLPTIRVIDRTGAPVPGAAILAILGRWERLKGTTDLNGEVMVESRHLRAGGRIRVFAGSQRLAERSVAPGSSDSVTIRVDAWTSTGR